jgi:hypothetical protein
MSPLKPAGFTRCSNSVEMPGSAFRYTWNHFGPEEAWAISSRVARSTGKGARRISQNLLVFPLADAVWRRQS